MHGCNRTNFLLGYSVYINIYACKYIVVEIN